MRTGLDDRESEAREMAGLIDASAASRLAEVLPYDDERPHHVDRDPTHDDGGPEAGDERPEATGDFPPALPC